MNKILIVDKQTLKILHKYDAEAPSIASWGGMYGDNSQVEHIVCPHVLDSDCVKIVLDQLNNMTVEKDEALSELKTERAWDSLRNERNKRLSESDWTQVLDAPLNEQDKLSWKQYRQSLRDLPETCKDPMSPLWPNKPDVQI